ncbi:MAG: MFS transporter [Oscillospiraceae bacterium]|nr:MFS transporter [Oscillospiraceae bacterium]
MLTVYLPFIEAQGISHSAGSAILSVRCFSSFVTTLFLGVYFEKLSLRRGILLASLVGAAAPLVFCLAGSNVLVYYAGAVLAGFTYGAGCVYPVSLLISNWFSARKGLALGLTSAGSGLCTMVFAPLLSSVVLNHSLHTAFVVQSVLLTVSAVVVYLVIRDVPAEMGLEPYGAGIEESRKKIHPSAAPMPRYMLGPLAVMMLLNGGAGFAFSGHLSVLAQTCGYSAQLAANMVSLFGFMLIISKLGGGQVADHIGTKRCSVLLMTCFITGCFFVLGMDGVNPFWCFALVAFLGGGASLYNMGPPLWAEELSSKEQYAGTLKWLQIFYNLGGILFSVLPGFIADRTGEYKSSYLLFGAMIFVSMNILLWAYRRQGAAARKAAG